MNNNYRFDTRSKEVFAKNIKDGHVKESIIVVRLCIYEYQMSGKWPTLKPIGIDATGELIEDDSKIDSRPDYKIDDRNVEITRSDVICSHSFHQKTNKVKRCIEEGNDLVFVNGFVNLKEPEFIRLNSKQLEEYTEQAISKYNEVLHPGGKGAAPLHKKAFRYNINWFNQWKVLPSLNKQVPKEYQKILKLAI